MLSVSAIYNTVDVESEDLDMDGDLDVVFTNGGDPAELCVNNGSENFTCAEPFNPPDYEINYFDIGDLNGDGYPDLILPEAGIGNNSIFYINDGLGNFSEYQTINMPAAASGVDFGDLDNDGDLDAVFTTTIAPGGVLPPIPPEINVLDSTAIFLNDGYGFFNKYKYIGWGESKDVTLVDLDYDGDLDILVAQYFDGFTPGDYSVIYRNHGNLNFVKELLPDKLASVRFVTGDFDMDGDMDFVLNQTDGSCSRFEQKQNFSATATYQSSMVATTTPSIKRATLNVTGYNPTGTSVVYKLSSGEFNWAGTQLGPDHYNDVFFQDASVGYAIGNGGYVIYSNDGGNNWFTRGIPAEPANLYTVMSGGTNVFVGGAGGKAYLSVDSGNNWGLPLATGTIEDIRSFGVATPWYIVGTNGMIRRSNDNGTSWNPQISGVAAQLNKIVTRDDNLSFVVGNAGTILKTTNGGVNWNVKTSGVTEDLNGLICIDDNTCVATGAGGRILKTTDGGETWLIKTSGTTKNLNGADYVDANQIWVAADGDAALYSNDGGENWIEHSVAIPGFPADYKALSARADLNGVVMVGFDNVVKQGSLKFEVVTPGVQHTFNSSNQLYWKAEMSTTDPNETPVIQAVSIDYSTTTGGGSHPPPPPPAETVPTAPTIGVPMAISDSAIQWTFTDNSSDEAGFKLFDSSDQLITTLAQPDAQYIEETDLMPNSPYSGRKVAAYNDQGNSDLSAAAEQVYTLAQVPGFTEVLTLSSSQVKLTLDEKNNPNYTEYAIYEMSTLSWLQADGNLGATAVWQTAAEWGEGITIKNLEAETVYSFKVKARNVDNVESEFSGAYNAETLAVGAANVTLSKTVTINNPSAQGVRVYFGHPIYAAGSGFTFLDDYPVYAKITSWLILLALLIFLVMVVLVIHNAEGKLGNKIKYTAHVIFKDITFQRPQVIYKLLSKKEEFDDQKYQQHHQYYRVAGHSFLAVLLLGLIKAALVGIVALMVYGNLGSQAADDDGRMVYNGDILTYQIIYSNSGEADVSSLTVKDSIPLYAEYVAGSLNYNGSSQTDSFDADTSDYNISNAGAVTFNIGDLPRGLTGYVEFKARVKNGEVDMFVRNSALALYNQTFASSNQTSNQIGAIQVEPIEPEPPIEPPPTEPPVQPTGGDTPTGGDQPTEPTEPTTPTEPIEPTEPTTPTEPTEPTEPTTPTEPTEPTTPTTPSEITPPVTPIVGQTVPQAIWNKTKSLVAGIQEMVLDNPQVENVNNTISVPLAIALMTLTVGNMASATAAGIGVFTYLQFFATQPFLLFGRRKRERWGIVYDSITKVPLALAIVRVFDQPTGRLVQTRVTDKDGRYEFILNSGSYTLEVTKDNYKFPSEILLKKEQDEAYYDLYHGATFTVGEKQIINYNIPVDPNRKSIPIAQEIKLKAKRHLQYTLAWIGPISCAISMIIAPRWWVGVLLVVQLFLLVAFKKLAKPQKIKNWGVVNDLELYQPLKDSVVRVFDKQYNKLLESQVTDKDGRYGFLVTPNTYYLTAQKLGYLKYQSEEIPITSEQGDLIVNQIPLRREDDISLRLR